MSISFQVKQEHVQSAKDYISKIDDVFATYTDGTVFGKPCTWIELKKKHSNVSTVNIIFDLARYGQHSD